VMSIKNLSLEGRVGRAPLRDITLEIRAGDIVGIYGLMGAGRTELLESILGVHADARGEILLGPRAAHRLGIHDRVDAGVVMVPEDRKAAGLVATLNTAQNMTLSSLDRLSPRGYLSPATETSEADTLRESLRIKCAGVASPITSLSGGNQQKVLLARGLMNRPRVMLLDEPTRGVDVAAKAEIMETIRHLAAEGMAVVFATSELAEALDAATRIVVMADGRITAEFSPADATEAAVALAASPRMRSERVPA
jgi:erythritol transport system ATP-binding protein